MDLAVHMRNKKTGEKRIKKIRGADTSIEKWECKDFHHGSDWIWTGTEPFHNVAGEVVHMGRGYYKRNNPALEDVESTVSV